ncbi:unnamed protein product [Rotaria sordida]|uniref:Uncharacterized protein n=1 Tax=Rotaria sordida TaxID=392033 RepID=A0A813W4L5_9BILA|nr:unnamed protein product [Rotaria sordida]CAF0846213.1 unnamed protein product [Rotaria sordida]
MAQQRTLKSFAPIQGIASDTRFRLSPGDDDSISIEAGVGQEGDLVLVEAMSDTGAYKEMEDLNGYGMRVYKRQRFIAVLGNRESSKYLVGGLPDGGLPIWDHRQYFVAWVY